MRSGTSTVPKRVGGGFVLAPRLRVYRPPDLSLRPINEDAEQEVRRPVSRRDEALLRAAIAGDEIGLRAAIRGGAFIDTADETGHTAVMKASRHNNIKCLAELVRAKADLNSQDENGWTALFWAAQTGSKDCAKELLQPSTRGVKGCDFNIKSFAGLKAHHVALNSQILGLLTSASQLRAEANNDPLDDKLDDPEDFSEFAPKSTVSKSTRPKSYTRGVRRARRMLLNAWDYHSESETKVELASNLTASKATSRAQRPQSAPAVVSGGDSRLAKKKDDFEAMTTISREMVSEPKSEPMVYSALWKYQGRTQTISFGNWAETDMQGC